MNYLLFKFSDGHKPHSLTGEENLGDSEMTAKSNEVTLPVRTTSINIEDSEEINSSKVDLYSTEEVRDILIQKSEWIFEQLLKDIAFHELPVRSQDRLKMVFKRVIFKKMKIQKMILKKINTGEIISKKIKLID